MVSPTLTISESFEESIRNLGLTGTHKTLVTSLCSWAPAPGRQRGGLEGEGGAGRPDAEPALGRRLCRNQGGAWRRVLGEHRRSWERDGG